MRLTLVPLSLSEPRSKTNFVDGTILDLRRRNENAEARPPHRVTRGTEGRGSTERERERGNVSLFWSQGLKEKEREPRERESNYTNEISVRLLRSEQRKREMRWRRRKGC